MVFRRDEESILPYFKVLRQLLNFSLCFWSRFQSASLREYHCSVTFRGRYSRESEAKTELLSEASYLSKTHVCLKYLETTFQKPRKRHFLLLISILSSYLVRQHVLKRVYTGGKGCFWNWNPFGRHGCPSHGFWERHPESSGNYTSQQERGNKGGNSRSGATTGKRGAKLHTSLLWLSITNEFISWGQKQIYLSAMSHGNQEGLGSH